MGINKVTTQDVTKQLVKDMRDIYKPKDPMSEEEKQKLKDRYANDPRLKKCLEEPELSSLQIDKLDRETVKQMKLDLDNLIMVLEVAFSKLKKMKKVILIIGNTGCGKSTLLGSILYGSDQLHSTKI